MKVATPRQARMPRLSDTELSVMEVDGVIIVVDQYGHMLPNQIKVSVESGVDCVTKAELTFNVINRNG